MVDICTTIFVIVFCYGQWTSARTFTTAVRGVIGSYLIKDEDKVIVTAQSWCVPRPACCVRARGKAPNRKTTQTDEERCSVRFKLARAL